MKRLCLLLSTALLILIANMVYAVREPEFELVPLVWDYATHIVVASEREKGTCIFTVLESWKGDLTTGETVNLSHLKDVEFPYMSKDKIYNQKEPAYVSCSRVILFLNGTKEELTGLVTPKEIPEYSWKDKRTWPLYVQTAWVERGKIYVVGPMGSIAYNSFGQGLEADFKSAVLSLLDSKKAYDEAIIIADPAKRAEALLSIIKKYQLYDEAELTGELVRCGEAALPAIKAILRGENPPNYIRIYPTSDDIENYGDQAFSFLKSLWAMIELVKIEGIKAGPELTSVLTDELLFWKEKSSTLPNNWNSTGPERNIYYEHRLKTLGLIRILAKLRFAACKTAVADFRDFWRTDPKLQQDEVIIQNCNRLFEVIDADSSFNELLKQAQSIKAQKVKKDYQILQELHTLVSPGMTREQVQAILGLPNVPEKPKGMVRVSNGEFDNVETYNFTDYIVHLWYKDNILIDNLEDLVILATDKNSDTPYSQRAFKRLRALKPWTIITNNKLSAILTSNNDNCVRTIQILTRLDDPKIIIFLAYALPSDKDNQAVSSLIINLLEKKTGLTLWDEKQFDKNAFYIIGVRDKCLKWFEQNKSK